jgi:hypothetical protein
MKFLRLGLLITFMIFFGSLYAQNQIKNKPVTEILSAVIQSMGKNPDMNLRVGNIDRKNLKSVLYVYLSSSDEITPILINKAVFNYEYFNKEIYFKMKNQRVDIKVEKYLIQGKTVYVATHIQKH